MECKIPANHRHVEIGQFCRSLSVCCGSVLIAMLSMPGNMKGRVMLGSGAHTWLIWLTSCENESRPGTFRPNRWVNIGVTLQVRQKPDTWPMLRLVYIANCGS